MLRPHFRSSRCRSAGPCAVSRHGGMVLLDGVLALLVLTAGLAALATVALHGLRDSRAAARTAHAVRLLHDGAEQLRLDPAGTWLGRWQQDIAAALPAGAGQHTARSLIIEWHETREPAPRSIELPLIP